MIDNGGNSNFYVVSHDKSKYRSGGIEKREVERPFISDNGNIKLRHEPLWIVHANKNRDKSDDIMVNSVIQMAGEKVCNQFLGLGDAYDRIFGSSK